MPTKHPKKLKSKKKALTSTTPSSRLARENKALKLELAEAHEQQTATSEMLRMIAHARTDLPTVMDTITENAARLYNTDDALVHHVEDNALQLVSHFGSIPSVEGPGRN